MTGIGANRYAPATGWGTAVSIQSADFASFPKVAVAPDGNATVVWHQYNAAGNDVYANRYTPATGWGTAVLIESSAGNAVFPQVAVDPDGNATAVWSQFNGATTDIWSNRFE